MKVLIFSLGAKGFSVVKALVESSAVPSIYCVIGQDNGVDNDFSAELAAYCEDQKIEYCWRKDAVFDQEDYDLFLAIGWRWMVRGVPQEKLIVFHDSLLPKYRGFAPLVNALINREKIVGVTALLGAEEYDRGNILLQKGLDIHYPTCISREIHRISILYADLAVELFAKLSRGEIQLTGYPQDDSKATYSLWRDEEDYRINWNDNADNIQHFINCVASPYRGASAILDGSTVRILDAMVKPDVTIENRAPGKTIFFDAGLPVVVCGTGLLLLTDVRDEQGKAMLPLTSFRNRFY